MRQVPIFLLTAVMAFSFSGVAWSQLKPDDYPTRPIEVVCQFGAGGGSDVFVRSLMIPARKYLKVPINVTNLPGSAGVKASGYVLSQPADGYTLYNFSPEQIINTILGRENYREFVPICNVQQDQSMFFVRQDSPFKTIQDVIKYAKENPGTLHFAGTAAASLDEVIVRLFAKKAKVKVKYVPFDEAQESHAAVLNGHDDLLHEEPGVVLSLLENKKLRPLIVFSEKRIERFPDVPTARELGYDITLGRWRGLSLKKGTPSEIINYLADVFKKSTEAPTYKAVAHVSLVDLRPGWKGPEEYGRFWEEEYARYGQVLGALQRKKHPPQASDQGKGVPADHRPQ